MLLCFRFKAQYCHAKILVYICLIEVESVHGLTCSLNNDALILFLDLHEN